MEMKGWMENGAIMMCMDKGGHYDREINGWKQQRAI